MNLASSIGKILGGNVLLVGFLSVIIYNIKHQWLWIHLSVTSIIFSTLTILVIIWTHSNVKHKRHPQELLLTNGLALVRMFISIAYLIIYKELNGSLGNAVILSFIIIYLYYLIIDVLYLTKLLAD